MNSNLYPITTDNIKILLKIHKNLLLEDKLREIWGLEAENEWNVRKYFVKQAHELVKLVKPKVIVCMGKSAYNDFTYSKRTMDNIFQTKNKDGVRIIGFSRHGNWSYLIPELAKMIYQEIN